MWWLATLTLALGSSPTSATQEVHMDAPFGQTTGQVSHVTSIGSSVRQIHQKARPITPRSPMVFGARNSTIVIWGTKAQIEEDLQQLRQLTAIVGFSHSDNSVFEDLERYGPRGIEDVVISDPPDTVQVGLCVEKRALTIGKEDWTEIFDATDQVLKEIKNQVDWVATAMLNPYAVMGSRFIVDLLPETEEQIERDHEEMKRMLRSIDESALGRAVLEKLDVADLVSSIVGNDIEKVYVFTIQPGFRGNCVFEKQRFEGIERRWKSASGVYGLPMRMSDVASKFRF